MYSFDFSGNVVAHADHNWEEWHAYLSADLPVNVSGDATGICCHTCQTVVVDQSSEEF